MHRHAQFALFGSRGHHLFILQLADAHRQLQFLLVAQDLHAHLSIHRSTRNDDGQVTRVFNFLTVEFDDDVPYFHTRFFRRPIFGDVGDQSSPTFLRIDWQQDPQADPVTMEQQASQAHAGERGGYSQARLEPAQFKGLPAALLEFTYQDGETWHGSELGVRSPRHHIAMAIYARDRDWGSGWALFEAFKASFVPPTT